jgi:hypothetical protein
MRGQMVARRCFVNLIEREMPFMRASKKQTLQELACVGLSLSGSDAVNPQAPPKCRQSGAMSDRLGQHCHCEKPEGRRSNPESEIPAPGLLRGACRRAGHFGPDPLARNDDLI